VFNSNISDLILDDKKFRDKHMPENWFVSTKKDKIYRRVHGKKELLYKTNKTRKRVIKN